MNTTQNNSIFVSLSCSLEQRVYTPLYLFVRLVSYTYLRALVGPGILLNTICLIVLSRPRLAQKSTTILFLRVLALFDIFSIILKYLRAEVNYQSLEHNHEVFLLVPSACKTIIVLMNASVSIAMWTIVLMSLDKLLAVRYPLKSSIWLTQKRAFYLCCFTIGVLLIVNLLFIKLSGIIQSKKTSKKYCGITSDLVIVDFLTASILPIALITATNIAIAVSLHRASQMPLDFSPPYSTDQRESDAKLAAKHGRLSKSARFSSSSGISCISDALVAAKRRTSAQVTRMLLAVTISLIVFNIPNTMFFIFIKIKDTRSILKGRLCSDVTDHDIRLYKFGFYSSIIQDILSDLPHIVNFFLYCVAGKKFRMILTSEIHRFLIKFHCIRQKQQQNFIGDGTDGPGILDLTLNWARKNRQNSLAKTALMSSNKPLRNGKHFDSRTYIKQERCLTLLVENENEIYERRRDMAASF